MDKKEKKGEKVVELLENYRRVDRPLKKIIINNFIGGIAWFMGTAVGATLIIALITYIIGRINLVPFIGSFVLAIIEFVQKNNPNL